LGKASLHREQFNILEIELNALSINFPQKKSMLEQTNGAM
jgi:hypothetical protein